VDIGIIVDSASNFTLEEVEKYDLGWIPLHIVYPDGTSIPDTPDHLFDLYDDIATGELTTSQPSPDTMHKVMTDMLKRYSRVVYFSLSSSLSGTYNTAKMVASQIGEKFVKVIDTRQMATGIDVHVLAAMQCLLSGGCTFDNIGEYSKRLWGKAQIMFLLETLDHLKRSGRISRIKSIIGSVLRIMPILYVDSDGYVNSYKKVRGTISKGLKVLEKIFTGRRIRKDVQPRIIIGRPKHKELIEFANRMAEKFGAVIRYVRPTTAVHTGIWGVGMSWVDG